MTEPRANAIRAVAGLPGSALVAFDAGATFDRCAAVALDALPEGYASEVGTTNRDFIEAMAAATTVTLAEIVIANTLKDRRCL